MFLLSSISPPTTRSVTLLLALLVIIFGSCAGAQSARGIFIYHKSVSHPQSSCYVMEYVRYRKQGVVTDFTLPSRRTVRITSSQPLKILPYLHPRRGNPTIRSGEAVYWRQQLAAYKHAYNFYVNARPFLERQIVELELLVRNLTAGKAWFEGAWVADEVVDQTRKKRNQARRSEMTQDKVDALKKQIDELDEQISALESEIHGAARDKESLARKIQQEEDAHNQALTDFLKKITRRK